MKDVFDDVRFVFNPFFNVSNILASLWSVIQEINSPLLILYGDILFDQQIILDLINDKNEIVLAISSSILDAEAEKVVVEEGNIVEIGKEVSSEINPVFEFAGIVKCDQKGAELLYETLEEMAREDGFLNMLLTSIIERLIHKGHEVATREILPELWIDIDFPKDIQRAEEEILPQIKQRENSTSLEKT
jgi:choline kinase